MLIPTAGCVPCGPLAFLQQSTISYISWPAMRFWVRQHTPLKPRREPVRLDLRDLCFLLMSLVRPAMQATALWGESSSVRWPEMQSPNRLVKEIVRACVIGQTRWGKQIDVAHRNRAVRVNH